MNVWRAKINSGRPELQGQWDDAKRYCREAGVVGVGWGRPNVELDEEAELDEVLAEIAKNPNWRTGVATVSRLATKAADGDLVWTRDGSGAYWLGEITGPWRFDPSEEATRWDLSNVRPCRWLADSMRDYDVPAGWCAASSAQGLRFAGSGETRLAR